MHPDESVAIGVTLLMFLCVLSTHDTTSKVLESSLFSSFVSQKGLLLSTSRSVGSLLAGPSHHSQK